MIELRDLTVRYPGGSPARRPAPPARRPAPPAQRPAPPAQRPAPPAQRPAPPPPALGPLSDSLGAGTLAIVGSAHSGKTTLLKALTGLVRFDGAVTVDGLEVTPGNPESLAGVRAKFGMVFQNDALFDSMSSLENVALPLLNRHVRRREALDRAREALAQVGLQGQDDVLPERLSGGMRKRLGLARAIVARPKYLLVDDLLAGLDPATGHQVIELVFGLWRDHGGLIVAAADPAPLWSRVDEVLVLEHGQVLARGSAAHVREDPRVQELFGQEAAA